MTSEPDRRLLLALARDAIAAYVDGRPVPAPPLDGIYARPGGAFVTIHLHGELRGCIGHLDMHDPLGRVVPECAVAACSRDPRFPSITADELPHLELELSLLGALERVDDLGTIEIGRHGLVIEQGWHRGLLLPQVATEWNWDRDTFLAHTCRKAGLPYDAWKKGATMWRFDAEVFGEHTGARSGA
jgi:AmmeMemoRadiSam system protein A